MSLEELSAMYDPETMDFDEFVRTYNKPKPSVREEQDVAYEQSLAQDREKRKQKELQKELERQKEMAVPSEICIDDPKPTLAELRLLRLAKLAPEERKPVPVSAPVSDLVPVPVPVPVPDPVPAPVPAKPDYTKLTVLELKKLCKEKGLKGFTGKCKQELINMLQ